MFFLPSAEMGLFRKPDSHPKLFLTRKRNTHQATRDPARVVPLNFRQDRCRKSWRCHLIRCCCVPTINGQRRLAADTPARPPPLDLHPVSSNSNARMTKSCGPSWQLVRSKRLNHSLPPSHRPTSTSSLAVATRESAPATHGKPVLAAKETFLEIILYRQHPPASATISWPCATRRTRQTQTSRGRAADGMISAMAAGRPQDRVLARGYPWGRR